MVVRVDRVGLRWSCLTGVRKVAECELGNETPSEPDAEDDIPAFPPRPDSFRRLAACSLRLAGDTNGDSRAVPPSSAF